jgi:hypothetical protein
MLESAVFSEISQAHSDLVRDMIHPTCDKGGGWNKKIIFLVNSLGKLDECKKRDRLPGCQIKGACPGQWNKIYLLLVVIGGR